MSRLGRALGEIAVGLSIDNGQVNHVSSDDALTELRYIREKLYETLNSDPVAIEHGNGVLTQRAMNNVNGLKTGGIIEELEAIAKLFEPYSPNNDSYMESAAYITVNDHAIPNIFPLNMENYHEVWSGEIVAKSTNTGISDENYETLQDVEFDDYAHILVEISNSTTSRIYPIGFTQDPDTGAYDYFNGSNTYVKYDEYNEYVGILLKGSELDPSISAGETYNVRILVDPLSVIKEPDIPDPGGIYVPGPGGNNELA